MDAPGFLIEEPGPKDLVAIVEDDGETGWLYLYDADAEGKIIHAAPVYNRSATVQPTEEDVSVVWSSDFSKVAALVGGGERPVRDDFRTIVDLTTGQRYHLLFEPGRPGIQDEAWLAGFEWRWQPSET